MKVIARIAELPAEERLTALLDAMPYARYLGVQAEAIGDEVLTRLPFKDELVGNPMLPAIHGGVLGTMLEATCTVQLLQATAFTRLPKTIDFQVEYLRSARPKTLFGRASLTRQGRRVANVRAELWQDERARPVAVGRGHFLLDSL
ncbi:MAG: PaaI family thioesterase [Pseudomonadota bacterium]